MQRLTYYYSLFTILPCLFFVLCGFVGFFWVVFLSEFLNMKKMLFFSDFKKASRIKSQSVRAV